MGHARPPPPPLSTSFVIQGNGEIRSEAKSRLEITIHVPTMAFRVVTCYLAVRVTSLSKSVCPLGVSLPTVTLSQPHPDPHMKQDVWA